jgi:type VI secretion system protein ImpG
MDDRLLRHYERELQFLRDAGREFSQNYPKIAERLGVGEEGAPDPSVERLLEGVAFLTARIQLQLEAELPHFSENLLALVQPEALTPTPSFAVAQLMPDHAEGTLLGGYTLPSDSILREAHERSSNVATCEFRTLAPVTLWPVELVSADQIMAPAALLDVRDMAATKATSVIRLRLRTHGGQPFCSLAMDELALYLRDGAGSAALYEAIVAKSCGIVARSGDDTRGGEYLDVECIRPGGMLHDKLIHTQFSPYTVLKHFFAFPEGYRFVHIHGIGTAVKACRSDSLDVLILLHSPQALSVTLNADAFALFCTPVVNLFPKRCDRVPIEHYAHEYPIIADRSRPQDYQLHQVLSIHGFTANGQELAELRPMYGPWPHAESAVGEYLLRRATSRQTRSSHANQTHSEVFISLDTTNTAEIGQLAVVAMCSNGSLPLCMVLGKGNTDLVPKEHAPVRAIRLLCGPSQPIVAVAQGTKTLRAIHQLSRGYLPLAQADGEMGAQALRDLLELYLSPDHRAGKRWLEGICALYSETVTRRLPGPGPLVFVRGVRLVLTLDEMAYEGIGAVLFSAVLEVFLTRYAALNSFTELRLISKQRGELMLWPARNGQCLLL